MGLGRLIRPAGREPAQARTAGATYETIIGDYYTQYGAFPTSIYRGGMSVPGAWRASMILSDILGGVPWDAYRREADGINSVISPTPLFLEQPNPPDIRMTTFSSWALDLIWEGNAVGLVASRNAAGWPTSAYAIPSRDVGVRRVSETGMPIGAIKYNVGGTTYDSSEVVHIKGPCEPGALRGMGVLEAHMKTLTLAGAQADQSSGLANHGVPTGVLSVDNPDLGAGEAKAIKAQWLLDQATRSISVLNSTTHFEALAWNPQEIQLIEARQFTNSELSLIFGVPARLLNVAISSQSLTYTNLEQDDINILRYSTGGHLARFEGTLSAHMPRGTVAKANLDARLRPDTKTRYESHAIGISAGFLLKNEARALEDLKPVPGLDDRPEQLPAPRPAIKATATVDEAKAIEE